MADYLKAENLKCKRTFAKKLVMIAPIVMLLLAILSGRYFVENGYNWWYVIIFPGFITLLSALVSRYEEKKLGGRALLALPVNLKKAWTAKVSLIAVYTAAAGLIHLAGILIGMRVYNTASSITALQVISATAILIVVSLWQIPLSLFLSGKFGMTAAVLINLGAGTALEVFAANKPFWWLCPYSWCARLMCPVLGVLPQGVMAEQGDTLLNPGVIPVGILLSVALFSVLLLITAQWYSKREVK